MGRPQPSAWPTESPPPHHIDFYVQWPPWLLRATLPWGSWPLFSVWLLPFNFFLGIQYPPGFPICPEPRAPLWNPSSSDNTWQFGPNLSPHQDAFLGSPSVSTALGFLTQQWPHISPGILTANVDFIPLSLSHSTIVLKTGFQATICQALCGHCWYNPSLRPQASQSLWSRNEGRRVWSWALTLRGKWLWPGLPSYQQWAMGVPRWRCFNWVWKIESEHMRLSIL